MEEPKADGTHEAYHELRNAVWMLAIPLVLGAITFFGALQWIVQDVSWENQLAEGNASNANVIEKVEASNCVQPRPTTGESICAQSTDWWVPIDSTDCEGGQCYSPVYLMEFNEVLEEMEESYVPILIPGLIPLIFLFVVIAKIRKARKALQVAIHASRPAHSS